MDWALITAVAIPFGLTATALWVTYRISRKRKGENREQIQINAADVPDFKPTWRNTQ